MTQRAHQPGWEQSTGPTGRKSWKKTPTSATTSGSGSISSATGDFGLNPEDEEDFDLGNPFDPDPDTLDDEQYEEYIEERRENLR